LVPDTDVVYCEGWDPVSRDAYGVMSEAAAAGRDRDGAQYAVLLQELGRPVAMIRVAWAGGYLGVCQFDEQARRVREFDFRVHDPDRLYWCGFRGWLPGSPHDPEFFARRPLLTLGIGPDGQAEVHSSYRGRGKGHDVSTRLSIPGELRTIGRPSFGDWRSCVGPGLSDLSRYVEKLLAPLKSAEARVFAEEPVDLPVSAAVFGPRGRPELRFPDHDRAVEAGTEVWSDTQRGNRFRQTTRAYDKALAAYTRAIELDPDYTAALAGRGDTLRLLGRHAEAIADLTRAIELYPGFSAAHIIRARAYYALGRYTEALAAYDRAEEIGFTGTGSGFSPVIDMGRRGDIYRRLGRYDEALDAFNYALRFTPDDAVALAGRGATYQALGRDEEARADLARAAELAPGYAPS
jgi:hypothetical protein